MIPGWPYSVIAALEPGRTSWTAVLDAVRLGPGDDDIAVTAGQVRDVITRLIAAGHWREGDPAILVIFDAGYDVTRLAWLLADLPAVVLGRLRSDRVMQLPAPPRQPHTRGRPRKHGGAAGAVRPGDLAGPAGHHHHDDLPVRHRRGGRLGPGARPADPPRRLAGPRRPAARHRGHPDPAAGRSPARRPRPQAGVAVVLSAPAPRPPRWTGCWQAFLRRFDLEHTFRLFKQVLGWTAPKIRDPHAADRWTWLIITATPSSASPGPLAADLRLPWERPAPPGRLTPRPGPPGIPEHPRDPAPPGRCTETRQTRPRPPARIEEPPPRTPPRRRENHQKGTHPQSRARTRRLNEQA